MRAACAHAPRAWRARGGAPLLAFWMTWDGMGGTGMTWGVLNAAPLRERRIPFMGELMAPVDTNPSYR